MNLKNYVPPEVRLDQARHKARAAFGKAKVIVTAPASEAYREGWERIFARALADGKSKGWIPKDVTPDVAKAKIMPGLNAIVRKVLKKGR